MEIGNFSLSRKKRNGKEPLPPKKDVKRHRNWTDAETEHLLNAMEQVQNERGKKGFKFNEEDTNKIFELFNEKVKNHPYDQSNIANRIKVLKIRFNICYELAQLTGGGWDEVLDRPKAPSNTDYDAMIQAKGKCANFLSRGNFIWYTRMYPMAGGQQARGEGRNSAFDLEDPSLSLALLQQAPIQISEQGSSDEPEELTNGESDAVEQPRSGRGTSNNMGRSGEKSTKVGGQCSRGGRQSNESTFPASQGSGSKRKSTDESASDTSSRGIRGRRYRENAMKKQAEKDNIALAGFEIAKIMKVDVDRAGKKEEEMEACLAKMAEFCITGAAQQFMIEKLEASGGFRKAFLKWTTMDAVDFFSRNNYSYNPPDGSTSTPPGFNPMFHNFQSQPNFPSQAFPNQNYGGSNFSYHLNHPNL